MPVLTEQQIKQEYNTLFARYKKAFAYLLQDDADREKWLPEYTALVDKLNELVTAMKAQGIPYTTKELQEGFEG